MSGAADLSPFRRDGARYLVSLPDETREALRLLADRYRELLRSEDPSSDPGVARLFPPAREDDLIENLEYERGTHDELLRGRLRATDTLERTAAADSLTGDELQAWMAVANDLRLVLGTRLEVTEATGPADFADDPERAETYALYLFLTELVGTIVAALEDG